MTSPIMAAMGIGSSVVSGLLGAKGAQTNMEAQKLNIQGQMLQAMGQAFQMDVSAQQYDYQANINRYQAGVAELNKQISERNAAYARDVGEVEAQQVGMKHHAERSEMMAAQGASGLDVNVGSAARVRESMIDLGYYDQLVTRASAAKKAYGYEIEATMNEAQADIYRYTATQNEAQAATARQAAGYTRATATDIGGRAMGIASTAGSIGVMGSLVSAAGSVATKWSQASQSGVFG